MNTLMETSRLIITELTQDMAMDVHRNSLDEDTRAYVPDEVFETPEDAKTALEFLISRYGRTDGPLVYALITKATNKNIGYVQLVPIGDGKWEIGYHIAKAYTGQGYATEAVTAFLPVMAQKVGVSEIYGTRLLSNAASGRVLQKCGFQVVFTGEGLYHGTVHEISKSVWKAKCPKRGRSLSREGQGHYSGKTETIDQYIEEQDETVRPYLTEVRKIIHDAIPDAQERISWSMPTFWKGRNLIHFAASRKHLGLYPGGEATTVFAEKLAGYDVSKGTIRIPYSEPMPEKLISEIAVWCYKQYAINDDRIKQGL